MKYNLNGSCVSACDPSSGYFIDVATNLCLPCNLPYKNLCRCLTASYNPTLPYLL